MNAGAALYIGGKAETLKDGIALAGELIDSKKALAVLEKLIQISNQEVMVCPYLRAVSCSCKGAYRTGKKKPLPV